MGGVAYTSSNRTRVIWITPQRQVTNINGDYPVLSVVTFRFNNSARTGTSIRILQEGVIGQLHTTAFFTPTDSILIRNQPSPHSDTLETG
jgi:hypothetical protein